MTYIDPSQYTAYQQLAQATGAGRAVGVPVTGGAGVPLEMQIAGPAAQQLRFPNTGTMSVGRGPIIAPPKGTGVLSNATGFIGDYKAARAAGDLGRLGALRSAAGLKNLGPSAALLAVPFATKYIPGSQGTETQLDTVGGRAAYSGRTVANNAATFAGIGALGGPVGALGGGIVGAGLGGMKALNKINATPEFGGKGGKQRQQFIDQAFAAGLGASAITPVRQQLEAGLAAAKNDDERNTVLQSALQQLSGAPDTKALKEQQDIETQRILASQALASEFLTPQIASIVQSGDQAAEQQRAIAAQMAPGQYRDAMLSDAAKTSTNARQVATAYAGQIYAIPSLTALQTAQGQQQQVQQQIFSQQLQGLLGGGSSAGSANDLSALLAQAQGK